MTLALPVALDQVEEAELIRQAQAGPAEQRRAAFSLLFRRYLSPVYGYLYARVGDRRDAEDLVEQVFLDFLEALPRYRHQGSFPAWLFTIARRRAADFYRRSHPELLLDLAGDPLEDALDPLAQVLQNERLRLLSTHLRRLDPDELELLRLRFAAGLSFREIASILDRSEASVKMACSRLLRRLEGWMEVGYE